MVKILFLCTGNMFRSASAEYSLKKYLTDNKEKLYNLCGFTYPEIHVSSAGTSIALQQMHKTMISEFKKKNINIYNHIYMQINKQLIEEFDLIIAMGKDHQKYMKENFNINIPLFNEICYNKNEGILDIWEKQPKPAPTRANKNKYIRETINNIYNSMPYFIQNFKYFLK